MIKNNAIDKLVEDFFGASRTKGGYVEPFDPYQGILSEEKVAETLILYMFNSCKTKEDIEKARLSFVNKINDFAIKAVNNIKKSSVNTYVIAKAYLYLHNRFVNLGNTSEYSLYDFAHDLANAMSQEGKLKDISLKQIMEFILAHVESNGGVIKIEKFGKISCNFVVADVFPCITHANTEWATDFVARYEESL